MNVYDGIRNILKTLRLKEFLLGNKQKVPKNDEHFSANETRRFLLHRVIIHKAFYITRLEIDKYLYNLIFKYLKHFQMCFHFFLML